jgi:hypothetical protein
VDKHDEMAKRFYQDISGGYMRWIVLMFAMGCGSSVMGETAESTSVATTTATTGGDGGSAGAPIASAGSGGSGGSIGEGGAACIDQDPQWTCRPGEYSPMCDVMPTPCGNSEWCPDDVGRCPQKQCIDWLVNMQTGECGPIFLGCVHCCGPDMAWNCDAGYQFDGWGCCVEPDDYQ